MDSYIKTNELSVGYGKQVLISDINLNLEPGKIMTLIGPNGSGKSTILKTITGKLKIMGGGVAVCGHDISTVKNSEIAKHLSMVLTERIHPELMTSRDVISTGRYPYTGALGILSEQDKNAVNEAIELVHAESIADMAFSELSDGQRQRVMLARAIAQDTEVIILDEPTTFLDMYYKLELLKIIRRLAREKNKAILMSLHELDLVKMISDTIVCVDGSAVIRAGSPAEIFKGDFIQKLYGVDVSDFDPESCMMFLNDGNTDCEETPVQADACEKKHAKVLMIQGTMSNAGKSLVVAGLCRIFRQDGYRVAPFKSQNMALNSYITKDGLEMGRAQVMQAEACGIEPTVHMNPILLKPTSDRGSQIIVNGEVIGNMDAWKYFERKRELIPDIVKAFEHLEKQADIIVIEGAGSPAEINLRKNDIVNMGLAEILDAPVLLVGDIDRGGVFAQLLGTLELMSEDEKDRIKGLIINKFRGDKTILDPGIKMLEERSHKSVAGVVPYMNVTLDDEDSLSTCFDKKSHGLINISVIRFPRISNFTDFAVFEQFDEVALHYVSKPEELADSDLVILPGSKNTISDLKWMREYGFEAAVKRFAEKGPVIGICGGYQMLGKAIHDPYEVEEGGSIRGLGLLDIETTLEQQKTRTQVTDTFIYKSDDAEGLFDKLYGKQIKGYEIHMGISRAGECVHQLTEGRELQQPAAEDIQQSTGDDALQKPAAGLNSAVCGNVAGSYIHGIFDEGDIAATIVGQLAAAKGIELEQTDFDYRAFKESQYDLLADTIRESLDMDAIYAMLSPARITMPEGF